MNETEIAAIGVDLGGTKTEAIVLAPDGSALSRKRTPTPLQEGYDAVVANVVSMIQASVAELPGASRYTIGIGIPGSVDAKTGLVRNANSPALSAGRCNRTWSVSLVVRWRCETMPTASPWPSAISVPAEATVWSSGL